MGFKKTGKKVYTILKNSVDDFIDDNAIKLSASLAYYTIFSLPPLLIVIIFLCGIFFGEEAVRGEIFSEINGLVGNSAALQIQDMIRNVKLSHDNTLAAIVGIGALIFGSSGVFSEIQSSINYIWGLKPKPKKGIIKFLKNRLMSFSMIGAVGFLLMVSLAVNAIMDVLNQRLMAHFPDITISIFYTLNMVIVYVIICLLFTLIFKSLPDGNVGWKYTIVAAAFTSLFFMLGKFLIGLYLGKSNIASTYGAAGSLIIILLWVYYSAIILYFGAEFMKSYARFNKQKIIPNEYSVWIEKEEVEVPAKHL